MLRRRVDSLSSNESRRPPSSFVPTPTYPHVSSHRSLQMELRLYSPSVKEVEGMSRPLSVYGEGDQIGGIVNLDPSCSHSGRLSVSLEGAFMYSLPEEEDYQPVHGQRKKHVFFSTSTTFPVSPTTETFPRSAFREAFHTSIKRRPSASSLHSQTTGDRSYPFTFDLPRSARTGEEIPPTFSSTKSAEPGSPGLGSSGSFAVVYKVNVAWEPNDASEYPSILDVPILYQPDAGFQSLDALSGDQDSWLEMPLRSDRPMPFRCAVTLPTSVTFSRASSIPYFVVFTTTPRSSSLAREIAADATICVSILRQVTVTESVSLPPSPPQTPSGSSEDSDSSRGGKLLKRVVKTTAPLMPRTPRNPDDGFDSRDKPLPRLPTQTAFSELQTLHSSICIGFPKRPRRHSDPQGHPSLDTQSNLPDGLHKTKIFLNREMLPCIDWAGVSVKYYLDISVLVGPDDVRARVPIRII